MNKVIMLTALVLLGCATKKVIIRQDSLPVNLATETAHLRLEVIDDRVSTNSIGTLSSGALNTLTPIELDTTFKEYLTARLKTELQKKNVGNEKLSVVLRFTNFWISEDDSILSGNGKTKCLLDYSIKILEPKNLLKTHDIKEYVIGFSNLSVEKAATSTLETCISSITRKVMELTLQTRINK